MSKQRLIQLMSGRTVPEKRTLRENVRNLSSKEFRPAIHQGKFIIRPRGVPRGDAQDARASPLPPPCASPPPAMCSPPPQPERLKNASLFT